MQPASAIIKKGSQHLKSVGSKIKRITTAFLQKHRKKKIIAIILIFITVVIIQFKGGQEPVILVDTGEVAESSFEKSVFASGKLEVKDIVEFYAVNDTTVTEIMAETGQRISAGQEVLRTDDSSLLIEVSQKQLACDEIQAKMVTSESNIRLYQKEWELAQKEYQNSKILFENGAVSQRELEEAEKKINEAREKLIVERDSNLPLLKSQLIQAQLVCNQAREKLEKAIVVSPLEGILLNLPVKKGQEVDAGTLLAQIGNPDNLQIETGINEIDAAQLTVGNKVQITNNSLLTEHLEGRIEYISPIAEVVSTSQGEQTQVKIRIVVETDRKIEQLKPGFNVNLKVILNQKDKAIVIPVEAVIEIDGRELVYVVGENGLAAEREVETGLSNELFTEVIAGLSPGEHVILSPDEQIKDGVKVTARAASK